MTARKIHIFAAARLPFVCLTRLQTDVAPDADTANVEVLKWLRDLANVLVHKGTRE